MRVPLYQIGCLSHSASVLTTSIAPRGRMEQCAYQLVCGSFPPRFGIDARAATVDSERDRACLWVRPSIRIRHGLQEGVFQTPASADDPSRDEGFLAERRPGQQPIPGHTQTGRSLD